MEGGKECVKGEARRGRETERDREREGDRLTQVVNGELGLEFECA